MIVVAVVDVCTSVNLMLKERYVHEKGVLLYYTYSDIADLLFKDYNDRLMNVNFALQHCNSRSLLTIVLVNANLYCILNNDFNAFLITFEGVIRIYYGLIN